MFLVHSEKSIKFMFCGMYKKLRLFMKLITVNYVCNVLNMSDLQSCYWGKTIIDIK